MTKMCFTRDDMVISDQRNRMTHNGRDGQPTAEMMWMSKKNPTNASEARQWETTTNKPHTHTDNPKQFRTKKVSCLILHFYSL